jgi:hypothetical protein
LIKIQKNNEINDSDKTNDNENQWIFLASAEPRATTFTNFTWNADAPDQVVIELSSRGIRTLFFRATVVWFLL